MKEVFLKAICGEDEGCRREVLEEISRLFSSPPLEAEGRGSPPLIQYDGGDPAEFLRKARRLRERHSTLFEGWRGDFCPICGLRPVVFIRREVGDIYMSVEKFAKCSCGFEWRYSHWRCPQCGVEGRENFALYTLGGALVYRCRRCGFKNIELEGGVDEETIHLARVAVSYVD